MTMMMYKERRIFIGDIGSWELGVPATLSSGRFGVGGISGYLLVTKKVNLDAASRSVGERLNHPFQVALPSIHPSSG